jgi:hypothetical protein
MTTHDADLYREEHPEEFCPPPCPLISAEMADAWDQECWWAIQEAEALAELRLEVNGEEGAIDYTDCLPEGFVPRPCDPSDDLEPHLF